MGAIPDKGAFISRLSAWHRTGEIVGKFFRIEEILNNTLLAKQIVKKQLSYNGVLVPSWATFTDDSEVIDGKLVEKLGQFHGNVSEDYCVIQHTDGFWLLNDLVGKEAGIECFETAGTLFNGSVIFASARLEKTIHVGNDELRCYAVFITSHNGKYSFTLKITTIRTVCENTVDAAMNENTRAGFKIRHTKNAILEFQDAKAGLQSADVDLNSFEERLNFISSRMVTKDAMNNVLVEIFCKEVEETIDPESGKKIKRGKQRVDSSNAETRFRNVISQILDRYESNDGNAFVEQRGTYYNLLNAITGYVDHDKDASFEYATLGTGNKLKTRALEVITLAANGAPHKVETRFGSHVSSAPSDDISNADAVAMLLGV